MGGPPESEHPAPTLKLAPPPTPALMRPRRTPPRRPAPSGDDASQGSDTGANIVGGIGLVAGLAALGLALTRRRRGSLDQTPDHVSTGVSDSQAQSPRQPGAATS